LHKETQTTLRREAVDRALKALLLVAIIFVSSLLLLGFSSSHGTTQPPNPPTSPPTRNPAGKLEVSVTLAGSWNFTSEEGLNSTTLISQVTNSTPVSQVSVATLAVAPSLLPVNFTAVGVGLSQAPLHLKVSQPGQAFAVATPGLYRVSTLNAYYSLSLYAQVLPNSTTVVQVNLNQTLLRGILTRVFDPDSSGSVQPWEPVTIQVSNLSGLVPGSNVFIIYSNSNSTDCSARNTLSLRGFSCAINTPVLATVLQADKRSSGVWLVVSIPAPVVVQDLQAIYVETFLAAYSVNTVAS
jgi:hypothetical protein